ncbi:hypothetical protein DLJ46_14320 [Micromonospora globispora]|uniref:Uncharacterized protein n=1 Tax=Micromonospora globispora TaxID=1450148 RepID=A0A317K519_9ACTN|nr:hypothetical protein DLJ46_14320 [Micromonospora globispora]RQW95489.1 hypothetical protein DKL51_14855 [Micromonospora globispora]
MCAATPGEVFDHQDVFADVLQGGDQHRWRDVLERLIYPVLVGEPLRPVRVICSEDLHDDRTAVELTEPGHRLVGAPQRRLGTPPQTWNERGWWRTAGPITAAPVTH